MSGGLPRDVREAARFAADSINAHMRGLSVPTVALRYRYEPGQAVMALRVMCWFYGGGHVERIVPGHVFSLVAAELLLRRGK